MKIFRNRILRSFLLFMLFSAVIHIILLLVSSVKKMDFSNFNFFNIIDLDLFFPGIAHGWLSQLLSIIVMSLIFFVIYIFFAKYKKEK